MPTDPVLKKAQKRVKAKKGFYYHFISFVSVSIFFLLLNVLTSTKEWWFFYPILPWLVGVLIHYFSVFGVPGTEILTEGWEERELEREIRRILQRQSPTPSNAPSQPAEALPLAQEELQLPELEPLPEKKWTDKDFV